MMIMTTATATKMIKAMASPLLLHNKEYNLDPNTAEEEVKYTDSTELNPS
jgi:hypothetical protein